MGAFVFHVQEWILFDEIIAAAAAAATAECYALQRSLVD